MLSHPWFPPFPVALRVSRGSVACDILTEHSTEWSLILRTHQKSKAVMWSRRGLNGQCFCRRGVPGREMQARLQITYGHPRARPRPEGSGVCPGFSLLDGSRWALGQQPHPGEKAPHHSCIQGECYQHDGKKISVSWQVGPGKEEPVALEP
ncbi:Tenascin [Manis javanica]|nr:Tenascin [Manis javanica]